MGFHRTIQPEAPFRRETTASVTRLVAAELASVIASIDPFGVNDPCPFNAGGPHCFIGSCGDVACVHCARVVWA